MNYFRKNNVANKMFVKEYPLLFGAFVALSAVYFTTAAYAQFKWDAIRDTL